MRSIGDYIPTRLVHKIEEIASHKTARKSVTWCKWKEEKKESVWLVSVSWDM